MLTKLDDYKNWRINIWNQKNVFIHENVLTHINSKAKQKQLFYLIFSYTLFNICVYKSGQMSEETSKSEMQIGKTMSQILLVFKKLLLMLYQ